MMFVDILIGVDPKELQYLREWFLSSYGYTLETALSNHSMPQQLRYAVEFVLANPRPPPHMPTNFEAVRNDTQRLGLALGRASPRHQDLLDILLAAPNSHIAAMAKLYLDRYNMRLDVAMESSAFSAVTKGIAIHALRSAINIVHRDVLLLKQAGNRSAENLNLGIRICRMRWRSHWKEIKAEFEKETGSRVQQLRTEEGLFGELITAMARE